MASPGVLERAFDVLACLDSSAHPLALHEIGQSTGIPKPTVRRILISLVELGYVEQHPDTRLYFLGDKWWPMGVRSIGGYDVLREARTVLEVVASESNEQATIWTYDCGNAVCLDRIDGSYRVRSHTTIGSREPAVYLSAGRCLLSGQSDSEIGQVMEELPGGVLFGAVTLNSLPDYLAAVKARGFDFSIGDRWPEIAAAAAPIVNPMGKVIAAVGISGPVERLGPDVEGVWGPRLGLAARTVSWAGSREG